LVWLFICLVLSLVGWVDCFGLGDWFVWLFCWLFGWWFGWLVDLVGLLVGWIGLA